MASKYARRHYEDIAALLKNKQLSAKLSDSTEDFGTYELFLEGIIEDFSELFKEDNPAFDADRFKKACGF